MMCRRTGKISEVNIPGCQIDVVYRLLDLIYTVWMDGWINGWMDGFTLTPRIAKLDYKPYPTSLGTDSYFSLVGKSTCKAICRL
jgi:hypothetical protein